MLKAIAKEPERRDESAGAMAEDLRRFVAERPIVARRPGAHERVGRWMRRHKSVVAAIACGLVLAMVGLVAASLLLWKEESRARNTLEVALNALDRNDVYLGEVGLSTNPEQAKAILDLLQTDLSLYESLARQNPKSHKARWGAARAYRRVGDIRSRFLAMIDEAESAYRSADVFLRGLLVLDGKNVQYRVERAELLSHLGKHIYLMGGQKVFRGSLAAEAPLREAIRIDDDLMAEFPKVGEYQRRLAQNSLYLSGVLFIADQRPELQEALSRVRGILQDLVPESPAERLDLVALWKLFGDVMHATDRHEPGAAAYKTSIDLLDSLAADQLAEQVDRQAIVGLFGRLGQLSFCRSTQPGKEADYYARVLPLWDRLVAGIDLTPEELYLRASAHGYVSYLLTRERSDPGAAKVLARSIEFFERLLSGHPSVSRYPERAARNCAELGRQLFEQGNSAEALRYFERGLELRGDSLRFKADSLWYLTIYANPAPRRAVQRSRGPCLTSELLDRRFPCQRRLVAHRPDLA